MSTHKHIDRICAAALLLCLLLTAAFMNGEALGLQPAASAMGYGSRLFDTGRVHTIDLVMDDWDGFLETCEDEEYARCDVVIDGEAYQDIGIRAKGNTSLSMVSAMGSDRYSFKLEFDHYDGARTYYGLDKLSLNNTIQDTTYMKDYLTYRMMGAFGVDAPLCSYVYITVNGEDWGLYLAVEGVEDAFLRRNYGSDPGALYKPDSMSFGGGRGNGRAFDMDGLMDAAGDREGDRPSPPEGFDPAALFEGAPSPALSEGGGFGGGPGAPGGGMGSDDVKLRYIDDDPESYPNIFQNAKTGITGADQARLIAALEALGDGRDLEDILDIDEVLRYFVVHGFVCNGDSYTGSMVHNYYLYEEDGRLSMIPWDYNLAYGTFQSGDAAGAVNAPIDDPVSGGDSRPMVDWIFDSPAYTERYHQYLREFLETVDIAGLIDHAEALIAPYVEKDPTAFYTWEEFETGVETLRDFCRLRAESIAGQLDGSIPSTEAGQAADPASLVDASSIALSDMGTMDRGGGAGGGRGDGDRPRMPGEGRSPDRPETREGTAPEAALPSPERPLEEANPEAPAAQVLPGRAEGDRSPERSGPAGGLPSFPGETVPAGSGDSLMLAVLSSAVLLAGIIAASSYRRRGR